jgi:hypothetical protein|eukprot:COSAG02_NODE_3093_length_7383_cov_2.908018_2_plen_92_part_00
MACTPALLNLNPSYDLYLKRLLCGTGYFVYAQIDDVPDIRWLHIDLGDPVGNFGLTGRATAYGVGLLSTLAQAVADGKLPEENDAILMPKL